VNAPRSSGPGEERESSPGRNDLPSAEINTLPQMMALIFPRPARRLCGYASNLIFFLQPVVSGLIGAGAGFREDLFLGEIGSSYFRGYGPAAAIDYSRSGPHWSRENGPFARRR
jgi:hypothetical protein